MSNLVTIQEFFSIFNRLIELSKETNDPLPELNNNSVGKIEFYLSIPNQVIFGEEVYKGLDNKSAILFYSIVKGHALSNGNKRVGIAIYLLYLFKNGVELNLTQDEIYELAITVSASKTEEQEKILKYIKQKTNPMSKLAELKEKLAKINKGIASPATPEAQRKVMEKVKVKLESDIADEESKPAPKPVVKKAPAKKVAPKKTVAPAKKVENDGVIHINGKPYDVADCREAILAWEARRKQSKESNKEYKTKPVAEKITDNVSTAVKQAVDGVSDSRIENKASDVLKGAAMVEKAITQMFDGFEKMTGKKIADSKRKEIMAILLDIKEEAKDNV